MTIRRLDLSAPIQYLHVMAAGPSGAGKTHFCATFPQPVIIGAVVESGGKTVARMDRGWWYNAEVEPVVFDVTDHTDALSIIDDVEAGKIPCGTLCLEMTFYAKSVLAAIAPSFNDGRQAYGFLMTHLEWIVTRLHGGPWHAVQTAISDEEGRAAVAIPGQSGANLPALSDVWLQLEAKAGQRDTEFLAHTQPTTRYKARHRFGNAIPPTIVPRYLDLEHYLDLAPYAGPANVR